MLRLLSWSGGDKFNTSDVKMQDTRQENTSIHSLPTPVTMKRKRSFDDVSQLLDPGLEQTPTRSPLLQRRSSETPALIQCPTLTEGLPTPLLSPTETKIDIIMPITPAVGTPSEAQDPARRRRMLQQTIQTQLSLETLLKHKELRLIDQELAKCQIALEQLRRCKEIPFPSSSLSASVSQGTGPARRGNYGRHQPQSPAPWGVLDGPYSRHYSQWLLPDPQFDGGEPAPVLRYPSGKSPSKGRPIRSGFNEGLKTSMSSRSNRGSLLQSIPAGYGQPKEKATGPMILKRKSDGSMVKLVCPDCGRHDFGSAQGFINHCRIGHSRSFASHDAAAEACGEPVEYDESGTIKGIEPSQVPTAGNVHPLIRSARLLPRSDLPTPELRCSGKGQTSSLGQASVSPDFRASMLTPNLSALVGQRGLGLDLQEIVNEAKRKADFSDSEDEDVDEVLDASTIGSTNGRHPQVAGSKTTGRSTGSGVSSKGVQSTIRQSNGQAGVRTASMTSAAGSNSTSDPANTPHLSPNVPDFHQAPSLVDDDDEFEPPSPTSMSITEENEVEFRIQDDEDTDPSTVNIADEPTPCTRPPLSPIRTHQRRTSSLRDNAEVKEEKHVSFVNTTQAQQAAELARNEQRKRRKISTL